MLAESNQKLWVAGERLARSFDNLRMVSTGERQLGLEYNKKVLTQSDFELLRCWKCNR